MTDLKGYLQDQNPLKSCWLENDSFIFLTLYPIEHYQTSLHFPQSGRSTFSANVRPVQTLRFSIFTEAGEPVVLFLLKRRVLAAQILDDRLGIGHHHLDVGLTIAPRSADGVGVKLCFS